MLESRGPAISICAGDTVRTQDPAVLPYGSSISRFGFTCTSETTGMTCKAESGHGFQVSRRTQSLF